MPLWTPDSRAVIVHDGSRLWRVMLDGVQTPFMATSPQFQEITVHPDGTQIAFVRAVPAEQGKQPGVWVLENFLPSRAGK